MEQHHYICQSDPSPCERNICYNNGVCSTCFNDSYSACSCLPGYAGDKCEIDVDECTDGSNNCNLHATCTNSDGGFTCKCNHGYNGDGVTCTLIPRRVGFWPLDAEHLSNDTSGGGNHGRPVGTTLTEGPHGVRESAFFFAGNTQSYIDIPNNGELDVKRSFTILLYAYHIGGHSILDYRMHGSPGTLFWLFPDKQLYVDIQAPNPHTYYSPMSMPQGQWMFLGVTYDYASGIQAPNPHSYYSPMSMPQQQWMFLGVTYDYASGHVQLWKDGASVGSRNFGQLGHSTANPIRLGCSAAHPLPFHGGMSCVQIYNYALSQQEVQDAQNACTESGIDECAPNPCQNGGTCINGLNSYHCHCTVGYGGELCLTDLDLCAQVACPFNWQCQDEGNHFICLAKNTRLAEPYSCSSASCPDGMYCREEGPTSFSCRAG
ncbi:PREDICTED: fibropellin-1-like [Branchiostoma belcheri]|uniref:Fibropellin-1-like n=1 Tax=Branchiostoma belcheri TaxID=7741 RepID=A0A6P5ADC8_BRABE|nr:PREDICTED: fibropellin-1-like [Branchiostoma belcheri]